MVLSRNILEGQRFDRGTEFFRIADIHHLWVIADLHENEARSIPPGTHVHAALPGSPDVFDGTVSDVLPQFDPATRTLKLRIEVENTAYLLRPDMFVDVRGAVHLPAAIAVPVDAVINTGLQQAVFVRNGEGMFERRDVRKFRPVSPLEFEIGRTGNWASLI